LAVVSYPLLATNNGSQEGQPQSWTETEPLEEEEEEDSTKGAKILPNSNVRLASGQMLCVTDESGTVTNTNTSVDDNRVVVEAMEGTILLDQDGPMIHDGDKRDSNGKEQHQKCRNNCTKISTW
jgi:hypothetical protein